MLALTWYEFPFNPATVIFDDASPWLELGGVLDVLGGSPGGCPVRSTLFGAPVRGLAEMVGEEVADTLISVICKDAVLAPGSVVEQPEGPNLEAIFIATKWEMEFGVRVDLAHFCCASKSVLTCKIFLMDNVLNIIRASFGGPWDCFWVEQHWAEPTWLLVVSPEETVCLEDGTLAKTELANVVVTFENAFMDCGAEGCCVLEAE